MTRQYRMTLAAMLLVCVSAVGQRDRRITPQMLEFRIAPVAPGKKGATMPAPTVARCKQLLAEEGPAQANRLIRRYLWLPVRDGAEGLENLITAQKEGKTYLLVSNQIGEVMLRPRPGQPVWGLTSALPMMDPVTKRSSVQFTLDPVGARDLANLTKANLTKPLAMTVNSHVMEVWEINGVATKQGAVSEKDFAKANRLAKGLLMGMEIQTPKPVDPKAKAILDRLEKAGKGLIRAKTTYNVQQRLTGDEETRTGWVAVQLPSETTPWKFRASFDTLRLGEGPTKKNKVDYLFDGQWLTVAKHPIKSMNKYQIAADGEVVQAHRIGEGPFPMPFGQKTADVLSVCEVTTPPAAGGRPEEHGLRQVRPAAAARPTGELHPPGGMGRPDHVAARQARHPGQQQERHDRRVQRHPEQRRPDGRPVPDGEARRLGTSRRATEIATAGQSTARWPRQPEPTAERDRTASGESRRHRRPSGSRPSRPCCSRNTATP